MKTLTSQVIFTMIRNSNGANSKESTSFTAKSSEQVPSVSYAWSMDIIYAGQSPQI